MRARYGESFISPNDRLLLPLSRRVLNMQWLQWILVVCIIPLSLVSQKYALHKGYSKYFTKKLISTNLPGLFSINQLRRRVSLAVFAKWVYIRMAKPKGMWRHAYIYRRWNESTVILYWKCAKMHHNQCLIPRLHTVLCPYNTVNFSKCLTIDTTWFVVLVKPDRLINNVTLMVRKE